MPRSWFPSRNIFIRHWYLHIVAVTTLLGRGYHFLYTEKNGGSAWISRGSGRPNMMIDYRTAFQIIKLIICRGSEKNNRFDHCRRSIWSSQRIDLIILIVWLFLCSNQADHKSRVSLIMLIKLWKDYLII